MANLNDQIPLTFEKIYLLTQGVNCSANTATLDELVSYFNKFFDVEVNKYISSCFTKYDFLKTPVYRTSYQRKKTGDTINKVFYTNTDASNCIVSQMGFDAMNLYTLFNKVEEFYEKTMRNPRIVIPVLREFNKKSIKSSLDAIETFHKKNQSYDKHEFDLLKRYWELFFQLIEHSHNLMAFSLLLLYSVINAGVIHLVPYIEKTVKYNYNSPITDIEQLLGCKFVIRSALSSDLFLAHKDSDEPLSEEDTGIYKRKMLYTVPQNRLNIENAIFKIEEENSEDKTEISDYKEVDSNDDDDENPNDKTIDPNDLTLGGRKLEAIKMPSKQLMKLLIGLGVTWTDIVNDRRNAKRYHIKAITEKGEYYMQYLDWFKNSKIVFCKKKNNMSSWYIEKDDNGFKICPCGEKMYHLFSLDIPNATTRTFDIPLWLFPGTKTKAQRFIFYRIVE